MPKNDTEKTLAKIISDLPNHLVNALDKTALAIHNNGARSSSADTKEFITEMREFKDTLNIKTEAQEGRIENLEECFKENKKSNKKDHGKLYDKIDSMSKDISGLSTDIKLLPTTLEGSFSNKWVENGAKKLIALIMFGIATTLGLMIIAFFAFFK